MKQLFDVLIDALTNRPWNRVLSIIALLYLLWVVLPWALDAPPMNITSGGAPFVDEQQLAKNVVKRLGRTSPRGC